MKRLAIIALLLLVGAGCNQKEEFSVQNTSSTPLFNINPRYNTTTISVGEDYKVETSERVEGIYDVLSILFIDLNERLEKLEQE